MYQSILSWTFPFYSPRIRRIHGKFLILILALTLAACGTSPRAYSPAPAFTPEQADAARREATLAILPFTGGQGEDGETIAELFSFDPGITSAFTLIPRTSINNAIRREQGFQMTSGMTDPDTIAALGRQVGAKYVAAGGITSLGDQNLLIIAIVHTEDLRQIAGDIQTYGTIREIRGKLPDMAKNIVDASGKDASNLPRLAVPPVRLSGGADTRDHDTMAQILAVHLVHNGKYAVYPRTKSLEQVQEDYKNQFGGDVADEYLPRVGMGENPRLVLSVSARKLDEETMFNAAVINLETGVQEAGNSVDYRSLNDGMRVMEELALRLSGQNERADRIAKAAAEAEARKQAEAEAGWKKAEAQRKREDFKRKASAFFEENYPFSYWSVGVGVGTTFATPGLTLSPTITVPIVEVAYLDLGCDFGFFTNADFIKGVSYNSYYPYIRASAFVPIDAGDTPFGFHIGLGYGCMIAGYSFGDYDTRAVVSAFDVAAGFLLINAIDISYSVRTNFKGVNHKLSIGYVYRFGSN